MNKDQLRLSHQQEMVNNSSIPPKKLRHISSHSLDLIIGNPCKRTKTRASLSNINEHCAFVSYIEPKSIIEAKKDTN